MSDLSRRALDLLRGALGDPKAEFRDGQYEAIEALVSRQARLLVVQRTGWGKSSVYFISSYLLIELGRGPTLLVSPLLALMRNQVEAATKLGLRAETLNSQNENCGPEIERAWRAGSIDVLLVTPERLSKSEFQQAFLSTKNVGLLVVDEAHCISDWGHDFRPEYRRIARIIQALPASTPMLATTATANDRVVKDIVGQLSGNLEISRGSLSRDSLSLQVICLQSQAARMAWLADHLLSIPGTGIIYALTIRDADRVANWLRSRGVDAVSYHGKKSDEARLEIEQRLLGNKIKAVVATSALGMGFDKPDLAFVIHFQRPSSVVHYYQQVGRAGRQILQAHGVLLAGDGDKEVNDYFIKSCFPPDKHIETVLAVIRDSDDGIKPKEIEAKVNLRFSQIEKVLEMLSFEHPVPIRKQGALWFATAADYKVSREKIDALTAIRQDEQKKMIDYLVTKDCLMSFLTKELNDSSTERCGRCMNCIPTSQLPTGYQESTAIEAVQFLRRIDQPIEPRKKWVGNALKDLHGWTGNIKPELRAEEGRSLCLWADAGWGDLVRGGKQVTGTFSDDLVQGAVEMVRTRWCPSPEPTWVTCVPSTNNPSLVPDFAKRLAYSLGIPFIEAVSKIRSNNPQKTMQNSFQQCNNLSQTFKIDSEAVRAGPVLLVDDIVDSGWTLTVIAALLRSANSGPVFPLALAEASPRINE